MRIAVLFTTNTDLRGAYRKDWMGRDSNDHAFSVMKAISSLGHKPVEYHANLNIFKKIKSEKHKIDMVFNLVDDGFFSKSKLEPHVPALLDLLNIRYTGSDYIGLSTCANKSMAKKILKFHKIPTPNFQVFHKADEKLDPSLKFPIIVKPVNEDASIGIRDDSVVKNRTDLRKKIQAVLRDYNQPALAEEYIDGREMYVGILGDKKRIVLPVSEILFNLPKDKPKIVNYDAKWNEGSVEYVSTSGHYPDLPEKLKNALVHYSMMAGRYLSCRDYYRVDFRVDEKGKPYVLEVNPNPDISEDAGLADMAGKAGLNYSQMIDYIIRSARARKPLL